MNYYQIRSCYYYSYDWNTFVVNWAQMNDKFDFYKFIQI